jgi:hypothetical protein
MYLIQLGIHPLSGTSSEAHMRDDVEVIARALQLQQQSGAQLRGAAGGGSPWMLSALETRMISEELDLPLFVH